MYLILALLLQAAPTPTAVQQQRAVVVKGLDTIDADITELTRFIETRFAADSEVPRTGLAAESEDMDADGLHPIVVVTVIKDSPADVAGIMPGDRIVRVGARRIEHETAQAFRLITDGTAGPLQMTLRRNGTDMTVTVDRQPLACVRRSSARIDQEKWRKRLAELSRICGMVRSEIDNEAITPPEARYRAAKDQVMKIYGLFNDFAKTLSVELADALAKECTFLTKQ